MNSTHRFSSSFNALPPANGAMQPQATPKQLERLWRISPNLREAPSATSPAALPATAWYKTLGQWLVAALTQDQQVRIWTKVTPNGIQWNAYDPRIQQRFCGTSESDLRAWLERRYVE